MDAIVTTNFGGNKKGKLIILGGIQINMPNPMPGAFNSIFTLIIGF
jgi:hypothetical protein